MAEHHSLINKQYLIGIVLTVWFILTGPQTQSQNYFVTELDRAGQNGIWSCVLTETDLADQVFIRDRSFPEQAIIEKGKQGFLVSEIAFTGEEFVVVMDKPADGKTWRQVLYKVSNEEWLTKLREIRAEKKSVSEMLYARNTWYIIADDIEIVQARTMSDFINEDEAIYKKDQNGYYITNAKFGDGQWGFVFSKKPSEFTNQFYLFDKDFPKTKVNTYWEKGYRITDISYGKGFKEADGYGWFVIMTKFRKEEGKLQSLIARQDFPSKEIAEYRSISRTNRPAPTVVATTPRVQQSPSTTKVYGVFIGVEDYSEFRRLSGGGRSPGNLDYISNDAKMIYDYYKSISDASMIGELKLLLNKDASKQNILKQCSAIFSKADKDDVVIFYFSGHGAVGYFCSYDYNLFHSELSEVLGNCEAKIQICIADACHSGSWDTKSAISKSAWGNALDDYSKTLDTRKAGRCLLMAAQSDQTSLVSPQFKCSLFTYFLQKGLMGKADSNRDKVVTVEEIYKYLEKEVEKYSCEVEKSCFRPKLNGNPDSFLPIGIAK